MSKISDILAKNNTKAPRTATIKVSLDAEVSAQREKLEGDLEKAKAKKSDQRVGQADPVAKVQKELEKLLAAAQGEILTLKVTKLSGLGWVELTAQHPARPNVAIDRQVDYNIHAVCIEAARQNVVLLDGDDEVPFEHTDTVDEFGDLLNALSGWDTQHIVDAVFQLNVMQAAARISALGKASGAANA